MIKHIDITALHPHPKNPRLRPRNDVVEQIVAQLNGAMDEAHALIVRPNADGFEIISGHNRKLAGEKAGLRTLPCWIREMSDEDAYMALALNNAQGELAPLEIGFHQLGSGLTVRDYAAKVGIKEDALSHRVHAARVVRHVSDEWSGAFEGSPEKQMEALDWLHGDWANDHFRHLDEIHVASDWAWSALVGKLMAEDW